MKKINDIIIKDHYYWSNEYYWKRYCNEMEKRVKQKNIEEIDKEIESEIKQIEHSLQYEKYI